MSVFSDLKAELNRQCEQNRELRGIIQAYKAKVAELEQKIEELEDPVEGNYDEEWAPDSVDKVMARLKALEAEVVKPAKVHKGAALELEQHDKRLQDLERALIGKIGSR